MEQFNLNTEVRPCEIRTCLASCIKPKHEQAHFLAAEQLA